MVQPQGKGIFRKTLLRTDLFQRFANEEFGMDTQNIANRMRIVRCVAPIFSLLCTEYHTK